MFPRITKIRNEKLFESVDRSKDVNGRSDRIKGEWKSVNLQIAIVKKVTLKKSKINASK